jgi:hypothetical protein
MAVSYTLPGAKSRERSLLAAGATITLVGIALAVGERQDIAFWFAATGVVLTIVGLHMFGRTGADRPSKAKRKKPAR